MNCEPSVFMKRGASRGHCTFAPSNSRIEFVPCSASQRPPPSTKRASASACGGVGRTSQV
jgi:hypothetical protein